MAIEQLNNLLKNIMEPKSRNNPGDYIDFLNVACLLNGVRNGVHLDSIHSKRLLNNLKNEVKRVPSLDFNTRWETTIWNKEKISREQVLNSWAFKGDTDVTDDYWKNNSILLGNSAGYPTYTMDPKAMGEWSLNLTINYNGTKQLPVSMMGGIYDKTIPNDLKSVELIKNFLVTHILSRPLYHPDGLNVFLEQVDHRFQ